MDAVTQGNVKPLKTKIIKDKLQECFNYVDNLLNHYHHSHKDPQAAMKTLHKMYELKLGSLLR